jgi:hypothetical protein
MSKKNKKFGKDFDFEAPEVINVDDIGYMAEEVIHDRMNRLEHERNRLLSQGRDPLLWEVELAYLQREQNIRQTRSQLHVEYMKKFVSHSDTEDILDSTS